MRKLVLWGHDWQDYREMFDLSSDYDDKKILEYGSGPSAVNAERTALGQEIVSIDSLFALEDTPFVDRVTQIFNDMASVIKQDAQCFEFKHNGSLSELIEVRRAGMARCFADYHAGRLAHRYQAFPLNNRLSFADFSWDIAVSSHYFFPKIVDADPLIQVGEIKELLRVAKEVRIFPLIDRYGQTAPMLGPTLLALQQANYGLEVREVPYHLQKTGNAMLRIWAKSCEVGS
jgi:hypothetical protein